MSLRARDGSGGIAFLFSFGVHSIDVGDRHIPGSTLRGRRPAVDANPLLGHVLGKMVYLFFGF